MNPIITALALFSALTLSATTQVTGRPRGNSAVCNTGCGVFGAPVTTYYFGQFIPNFSPPFQFIAAGDFNLDGKPDLAAFTSYNGFNAYVWLFLPNGDGSFTPATSGGSFPSGVIYGMAAGDFNGDGKLDLALNDDRAADITRRVTFHPGNGDGTFGTPIESDRAPTLGNGPAFAGDFNGDGKLDLAILAPPNVQVALGNGDGSFAAPLSSSAGNGASWLAEGDFNRDGKLDLAVTNKGSNNLSILIGNGDGTFNPPVTYATGNSPSSVAVGDFNGDGNPDVAVANTNSGSVSILIGNGNGTFQPAVNDAFAGSPQSLAVSDFNGDGVLDLVVVDSNNRSILFGKGDGTFESAINDPASTFALSNVVVADFNADGRPDFVLAGAVVEAFLNTCPAPDLTVAATQNGIFTPGQSGATYTITVSDVGSGSTCGAVTVTATLTSSSATLVTLQASAAARATLPASVTPTALAGSGWTCTLATLSCSRSDVLATGSSYPPITLTVDVVNASRESLSVSVSGGGDANGGNNTTAVATMIAGAAPVLSPPLLLLLAAILGLAGVRMLKG